MTGSMLIKICVFDDSVEVDIKAEKCTVLEEFLALRGLRTVANQLEEKMAKREFGLSISHESTKYTKDEES
jgi:hypothetical protein